MVQRINKGNSYVIEITLVDITDTPINLSSVVSINYVLTTNTEPKQVLVSKSIGNNQIIIQSLYDGIIEVYLHNDDTDDLEDGIYYHEAALVDSGGNVTTILSDCVLVCDRVLYDF